MASKRPPKAVMTVRLPRDVQELARAYADGLGVCSLNALIAVALREYLKMRGVEVQGGLEGNIYQDRHRAAYQLGRKVPVGAGVVGDLSGESSAVKKVVDDPVRLGKLIAGRVLAGPSKKRTKRR